ncbi:putative F-box domain-containing protein [Tanacetum coccineum]
MKVETTRKNDQHGYNEDQRQQRRENNQRKEDDLPDIKRSQTLTRKSYKKSDVDSTRIWIKKTLKTYTQQSEKLPQHVLVRDDIQYNYVSIPDDNTFPQQKVSLTVPMSIKTLDRIVGSSEGLFCLYSDVGIYSGTNKAVIWNPSIRKSVDIDVPNVLDRTKYHTSICFGVRPDTLDPMLLSISWLHTITSTTWLVEAFRLSLGVWKSLSTDMPLRSTSLTDNRVAIGRFIYWRAVNRFSDADHLILSFDMISEEFTEIDFPVNLTIKHQSDPDLDVQMMVDLCKVKESLVLIYYEAGVVLSDFDVWMMVDSDPKSFEKIYSIKSSIRADPSILGVYGSRKSGELLIEVTQRGSLEDEDDSELLVYDPISQRVDYFGISSKRSAFFVSSYTESLLLLDH